MHDQIAHMSKKGITFKYISEKAAEDYLLTHTYYFKLKAYSRNYERYKDARGKKYIGLDFSYLQDLARIDMYFREIVLKMTIDIEHFIKVKILSESQKNEDDDAYKIVADFLSYNYQIKNKITEHSNNGYNSLLIKQYTPNFPLWVFLEIISFGDLTRFYSFYTKKFSSKDNISDFLWSARILRNAAAHNSCILNRLKESFQDTKINRTLMEAIKNEYPAIDAKKLKKYLQNPVIQDFLVILMLYKKLDASKDMLKKRLAEITNFFRRCKKHATYYRNNNKLLSVYAFVNFFIVQYEENL